MRSLHDGFDIRGADNCIGVNLVQSLSSLCENVRVNNILNIKKRNARFPPRPFDDLFHPQGSGPQPFSNQPDVGRQVFSEAVTGSLDGRFRTGFFGGTAWRVRNIAAEESLVVFKIKDQLAGVDLKSKTMQQVRPFDPV